MAQHEVEQICESGLATLFGGDIHHDNQVRIQQIVEHAYRAIYDRAKKDRKVLIGVNQTICAQLISLPGHESNVLYIVTLVGTVVDAELVKQQQRLQQFDPRVGRNN